MGKNIFYLFVVLAVTGTGIFYFTKVRSSPSLKAARQTEQTGDLQKALTYYGSAVFELVTSMDLPDINRSKIAPHDILKADIEKYITFITGPKDDRKDADEAMQGIFRCAPHGHEFNSIAEPKFKGLSTDEYLDEWNKTFFAKEAKIDPSHAAMASGNYVRGLSVLIINSIKKIVSLSKANGCGLKTIPSININSTMFFITNSFRTISH